MGERGQETGGQREDGRRMARPIWSGVITFGLVTVPVQMFSATEDHTVHFHQLQRGTNDRVRNKRVNERTGKSVDYADIVKGYEVSGGSRSGGSGGSGGSRGSKGSEAAEYIVVEPEELDEIAPGKSQVIEVSGFVGTDEVSPVYFARSYYLAPRGDQYTKPYELLRRALAESGRIGVATFVMRSKEYLVALRPQEDVLLLQTLHWADEVRDPHEALPRLPARDEAKSKELKTAQQLIETMTTTWNPEDYADTYEERVRGLVKAKAEGEEITVGEEPPEATNVVDLTEALERSVKDARARGTRGGRKRKSGGRSGGRPSGSGSRGKSASRSGGGNTRLADLTKDELYRRATEQGVPGRSSMNREQLIEALRAMVRAS